MAKQTYEGPELALRLYDAVVAGNPNAERKGAKMPYTSRNGHMFSFLDPSGTMALALPPEQRLEFLARYDSHLVEQHGRVMRDFVAVPTQLLERSAELQEWFDASYAWTGTRAPTPTTRSADRKGR